MNKYYFLNKNNQQQGPVEAWDLPKHGVTQNTLVWREGMRDWEMAASVPELSGIFLPPNTPPPFRGNNYASMGQSRREPTMSQKPDNLLTWSILATALCCVPTGIVAIIQSNKVNTRWEVGDYVGAQEAASNAKMWCFISLGAGIVTFIITFFVALADAL